jgi:hypothetical protein
MASNIARILVLLYLWSEYKKRKPDPSVMSAPREDLMTTETQVLDLVDRWAEAEQGNHAGALEGLLADAHIGTLQQPGGPPPS